MSKFCKPLPRIALLAAVIAALAGGNARADARDDVLAAYRATYSSGKIRIRSEIDAGGKKMNQSVEIHLPDSFHIKSDQMEAIVLPSGSYMKPSGQQWMRSPIDMGTMIHQFTEEGRKRSQESIANVQDLGNESADGKAAHAYSYDADGEAMGVKSKSHIKVWIDSADQRIVQMLVDGEAMGHKSKTTQHYEYDNSITITAPM